MLVYQPQNNHRILKESLCFQNYARTPNKRKLAIELGSFLPLAYNKVISYIIWISIYYLVSFLRMEIISFLVFMVDFILYITTFDIYSFFN